jgi:hypothetical protein
VATRYGSCIGGEIRMTLVGLVCNGPVDIFHENGETHISGAEVSS